MKIHIDPNQLRFNTPCFYIHVEQSPVIDKKVCAPRKKEIPKIAQAKFPQSAFQRDELRLKSILADHLMKHIYLQNLDIEIASQQSKLSHQDLLKIAKGNVGSIGFFQILSGLMQLRYDINIRLIPHHEHRTGEMSIHY